MWSNFFVSPLYSLSNSVVILIIWFLLFSLSLITFLLWTVFTIIYMNTVQKVNKFFQPFIFLKAKSIFFQTPRPNDKRYRKIENMLNKHKKSNISLIIGAIPPNLKIFPCNCKHYIYWSLAPRVGLEPTTTRLTAARSTDWAIEEYS